MHPSCKTAGRRMRGTARCNFACPGSPVLSMTVHYAKVPSPLVQTLSNGSSNPGPLDNRQPTVSQRENSTCLVITEAMLLHAKQALFQVCEASLQLGQLLGGLFHPGVRSGPLGARQGRGPFGYAHCPDEVGLRAFVCAKFT
mmetsp:Transcript_78996/g.231914  ORF Transcript_78996/g.231914 Transcript_78996/m.231914 type:complete len:142 (-) Transcript_78996:976-1401(-)